MNQMMLNRVRQRQRAVSNNTRLRQQRENYLAMVKKNREKSMDSNSLNSIEKEK